MSQQVRRLAAIVTGAGQNIGRACALHLAELGFDVLIHGGHDFDKCAAVVKEASEQSPKIKAVGCVANLRTVAGCRRLIQAAGDAFSGIDVVVNSVAIRPEAAFLELSSADWDRVLKTNLTAPFLICQAFLGGMQERRWGRIINFAGMNAMAGYNRRAHVSASKHGIVGLTKAIAREFAAHGITANVISPGPIEGHYDDPALAEHVREQVSKVPMGRLGTPYEVATAVGFLASDGGAFCTGQLIQLNGGAMT